MAAVGYIYDPNNPSKPIGFGNEDFSIRLTDRTTANDLIVQHHYSRKFYRGTRLHFAVMSKGRIVGILQYGPAMNPQSMASVVADTKFEEYLELNRMWLAEEMPRNSESKALSYSINLIKRLEPRVAWIQSFADERCGRQGVVYQAANFLYCGEHLGIFWELDGEFYHNSIMTNGRQAKSPKGSRLRANRDRAVQFKLRQFRYLYFIKQSFRRRLLKPVQPFPKHADEGSRVIRCESIAEVGVRCPGSAS